MSAFVVQTAFRYVEAASFLLMLRRLHLTRSLAAVAGAAPTAAPKAEKAAPKAEKATPKAEKAAP